MSLSCSFSRRFSPSRLVHSFGAVVSRRFVHRTELSWNYLADYPKQKIDLTKNALSQVYHPSSAVFEGGSAIVSYEQPLKDCDDMETFMNTWASLGTVGCIHTIKEGPLKGITSAFTANHVIANSQTLYAWLGDRSFIQTNEGLELVNVWQEVSFGDVIAADDNADFAAVEVKINKDMDVSIDSVARIGRISVAPDDIGDKFEEVLDAKWLGTGFISDIQPFQYSGFVESRYFYSCPASKGGFNYGDSGASLVEVVIVGTNFGTPPLRAIHGGQIKGIGAWFGCPVSTIHSLLQYPKPTATSSKQGLNKNVMNMSSAEKEYHSCKVKGVPSRLLPKDSIIVPGWDKPQSMMDEQPLYVKGVPGRLLNPNATIIPGWAEPPNAPQ